MLKEMYEMKQKEKEKKIKLANEIIKFKEKLQLEDEIEEKGEKSTNPRTSPSSAPAAPARTRCERCAWMSKWCVVQPEMYVKCIYFLQNKL